MDRIGREFALALVIHLNGGEVVIDGVNDVVHELASIVVQSGVKILLHLGVDFGLRLAAFPADKLQVLL